MDRDPDESRKSHSNTPQIGPRLPTQIDHKEIPKTQSERPRTEAIGQGQNLAGGKNTHQQSQSGARVSEKS